MLLFWLHCGAPVQVWSLLCMLRKAGQSSVDLNVVHAHQKDMLVWAGRTVHLAWAWWRGGCWRGRSLQHGMRSADLLQ